MLQRKIYELLCRKNIKYVAENIEIWFRKQCKYGAKKKFNIVQEKYLIYAEKYDLQSGEKI